VDESLFPKMSVLLEITVTQLLSIQV